MIVNVIIVIFIMMAEQGRVLESKGRCSGKLGEKSDWNEDGGRKLKQKPHNLIVLVIVIITLPDELSFCEHYDYNYVEQVSGGRKMEQKPHNLIILAIIIIVVILIMVIMVVMFDKLII